MNARAHVYVSGLVQGVFFRVETLRMAQRLGVSGWVRNANDQVEAIFEGPKDKVEEAIEFCRHGPPRARVSNLEVKWEEWTGKYQGFIIGY
ncbi:MAG TPA: acylphosphatase [Candidatus Acidoferrales bacterium]|nr:acylphosphatase [Candidatus Acidoferrales bacterium]